MSPPPEPWLVQTPVPAETILAWLAPDAGDGDGVRGSPVADFGVGVGFVKPDAGDGDGVRGSPVNLETAHAWRVLNATSQPISTTF